MKQKPKNPHSGRKSPRKKADDPRGRLGGTGRESKSSRETFPKRTKKPGAAGLANEARPGLGTRASDDRKTRGGALRKLIKRRATPHDREPLGRNAPLVREPAREQPANSLAHELERDTGVSGHTSAD